MSEVVKPKVNDALILAEALERLADTMRRYSKQGTVDKAWQAFDDAYSERAEWNDSALPPGLPIRFGLRNIEDPFSQIYVLTVELGKLRSSKPRFDVEKSDLIYECEFDV